MEDLFNLIRRALNDCTRDCTIFFCSRECFMLRNQSETLRHDLSCDHEEADTMLVAYASKVTDDGVTIRSSSGDIDIITLFVYHFVNCATDLYLDNGTGAQRKMLHINSCNFLPEERNALIGQIFLILSFGKNTRNKIRSWNCLCFHRA